MVCGEEAIKTGRNNHHFFIATPVEEKVAKIVICSVSLIFNRRANFYGNSHFQVKYCLEYLTDKDIYILNRIYYVAASTVV